jgi:hypothetical protein
MSRCRPNQGGLGKAARLPVSRILDQLDRLARLELGELDGPVPDERSLACAYHSAVLYEASLLDGTQDLAPAFDFDLPIANCTGYVAAGTDQKAFADSKLALEAATDFGLLAGGVAPKEAALGDLQVVAVLQSCLNKSLYHEPIARFDVAGEMYLSPDNHGAASRLLHVWANR